MTPICCEADGCPRSTNGRLITVATLCRWNASSSRRPGRWPPDSSRLLDGLTGGFGALTVSLVVLVVVVGLVAVMASRASQNASQQRDIAQRQLQIATAQSLAGQADTVIDDDPRTALMLGIAALDIHDGPATGPV